MQARSARSRCCCKRTGLVWIRIAIMVLASACAQDILRGYPGQYDAAVAELCAAVSDDALEEPEAKAALVWLLGEHAERVADGGERLARLLDAFLDEPTAVQLQLLSAAVKLFLKKPGADGAQARRRPDLRAGRLILPLPAAPSSLLPAILPS